MKHIVLLCLFSFITISVQSQEVSKDRVLTKQEYLRKSKQQRVASIVLLGAGIGVIGYAGKAKISQWESLTVLSVAFISGSVVSFASSVKNRRKAVKIDLSLNLRSYDPLIVVDRNLVPTVSFDLSF